MRRLPELVHVLILLTAAAPAAIAQDPACTAMAKIVASAAGNFEEIKGAQQGRRWGGKTLIPGFERCEISALTSGVIYQCSGASVGTKDAALKMTNEWVSKVESCFPGTTKNVVDTELGRSVFFFNSEVEAIPYLGTLPDFALDGDKFRVTLTTSAPRKAAPVERAEPFVPPAEQTFCPSLTSLVGSADQRFAAIKGKGSADSGWDVTTKLAGGQRCTLNRTATEYSCGLYQNGTEANARQAFAQASQLVGKCLGSSYEPSDKKTFSGDVQKEFWKGNNEPLVSLRLVKPLLDSEGWDMRIVIATK